MPPYNLAMHQLALAALVVAGALLARQEEGPPACVPLPRALDRRGRMLTEDEVPALLAARQEAMRITLEWLQRYGVQPRWCPLPLTPLPIPTPLLVPPLFPWPEPTPPGGIET